jgi:hypothetical protein
LATNFLSQPSHPGCCSDSLQSSAPDTASFVSSAFGLTPSLLGYGCSLRPDPGPGRAGSGIGASLPRLTRVASMGESGDALQDHLCRLGYHDASLWGSSQLARNWTCQLAYHDHFSRPVMSRCQPARSQVTPLCQTPNDACSAQALGPVWLGSCNAPDVRARK